LKVAVTGGLGFIGSNFIDYVLKEHNDWQIINVDKETYASNRAYLSQYNNDSRYELITGDISIKSQIGNGDVRCVGVALLGQEEEPCNSFLQGDHAIFWAEFEVLTQIEVPIFGVVLINDRNIIVHGKNSWQEENDWDFVNYYGRKIICRYEVALDLGPGEYVFGVALSSISSDYWKKRKHISHDEMSASYLDLCHLPDVGHFSIGLARKNGIPVLTHHGVANLSGKMDILIKN
jgi:lipopolysaccharide transport system ATP-binding protein